MLLTVHKLLFQYIINISPFPIKTTPQNRHEWNPRFIKNTEVQEG